MPDQMGFLIQPLSARGTCPACNSDRWACSVTYWVCWDCGHQHYPELSDLRAREHLDLPPSPETLANSEGTPHDNNFQA